MKAMTKSIIPNSKPRISKQEIDAILSRKGIKNKYPLLIIGIRGYYKNSMGEKGLNDYAIYDDCIIIYTQNTISTFNANTDPSNKKIGTAILIPGLYESYKFDVHEGKSSSYPAICQRLGTVKVNRVGKGDQVFEGNFGINIHKGGSTNTWSEGCQTIPSVQWDAFYALAKSEQIRIYKDEWNKKVVPYLLILESEI